MPNFTLDDTDTTLSYSANGWAVQTSTDPDIDQFFDKTYHAAEVDGASMSFTFQGIGFALYGSKGPQHGKFQVQFDSTVVNLDASAATYLFQQELFAHTFTPVNASASHLVKLTAVLSGDGLQGKWLDVDYITFASGPSSDTVSTIGTVTSLPPWLSGSSSTSVSLSTASSAPFTPSSSASTASSSSKTPTILAALFGALLGLALVLILLYILLTRVYNRGRARERVFRYGQSSVNPVGSLAGTATAAAYAQSAAGSGKSAGAFASPAGGGGTMMDLVPLRREESVAARDGSLSSNLGEMRSVSTDVHGYGSREGAGTPGGGSGGATRALLSTSPIAWTRQKKHKGDADSLRTDFLQV